jgi:hypothetical protein
MLYIRFLFIVYCVVIGTYQSLKRNPLEIRHLIIDNQQYRELTKLQGYNVNYQPTVPSDSKKLLRVVQISDPHLGPFMPLKKLKNICEKIVELDPDLVFLTGDFFTIQGFK